MAEPKPTIPPADLVFTQIEAALAVGQIERARQLWLWARQTYGASSTLDALKGRLDDLLPTVELPRGLGPNPAPSAAPAAPIPAPPSSPTPSSPAPPMPAGPMPSPPPPSVLPASLVATQKILAPMGPPADPLGPVAASPPAPSLVDLLPPAPSVATPVLPPPPPLVAPPAPQLAPPQLAPPQLSNPLPAAPTMPLPGLPAAPPPMPTGIPLAAPSGMPLAPPPPPPALPPQALGVAPATVEAWIAEAQAHLRGADYQKALALLQRASASQPDDANLTRLLQNTEKAAARHHAALEREQSITRAAREIENLLATGTVAEARTRLREALAELGKHPAFDQMQAALQQKIDQQRRADAGLALARAKELAAAEDWRGALSQAEQALALDPDHGDARSLQTQAQARIAQSEKLKLREDAVTTAQRDVERLLAAREPQQAAARLGQAIQKLGRDPRFEALAKKIDEVKTDLQYQLKNEWAERRAHEAESLIQEGVRLSLANEFARAVEKLEQARKLEPDHPELENKLATARGLLAKQKAEQEKQAEQEKWTRDIHALLEELELDRAESLLGRLAQRHGESERTHSLRQRLAQLRQAERGADILVRPSDLATLSPATAQAIADRERLVLGRYTWGDALLYPLRGRGPWILLIFAAWLGGLDAGALWVEALGPLRTLAPFVLLALATPLIGATLRGQDDLGWADFKPSGQAIGMVLAFFLTLGTNLPLFFLVATRYQHGFLGPTAGPWVFLFWWGCQWLVPTLLLPLLGSGSAFGYRYLARVGGHFRCLFSDGHAWWVTATLLGLAFLAVFLRLVVGTKAPELGLPLAAAVTAYATVLFPHLIGVHFRRRRLELAHLYA